MNNKTYLSTGIILGSLFLAGFILFRPSPKVSDAAKSCLQSMLDGTTSRCTSDNQEGALAPYHLTDRQQSILMRDFFGRRLTGLKIQKVTAEVNSVTGYGFAVAQLSDGSNRGRMMIPGMLYPSGPRILLASMIENMWLFERGGKKISQLTGHNKLQFRLEGVKHDRAQLTALGIPGFYDEDGNFQNWDKIQAFYERVLPLNP